MVVWTEGGRTEESEAFTALTAPDDAGGLLSLRLLEEAVGHLLSALHHVEPTMANRPTPCGEWTMDMLLLHIADSLDAVNAGMRAGRVPLIPRPDREPEEHGPASAVRLKACRLLRECGARTGPRHRGNGAGPAVNGSATVGGEALGTVALAGVGALEIGVHAWDLAHSTGHRMVLPSAFAAALLDIAPLVVTGATRPRLFADAVAAPPGAPPEVRLPAFLGRYA